MIFPYLVRYIGVELETFNVKGDQLTLMILPSDATHKASLSDNDGEQCIVFNAD